MLRASGAATALPSLRRRPQRAGARQRRRRVAVVVRRAHLGGKLGGGISRELRRDCVDLALATATARRSAAARSTSCWGSEYASRASFARCSSANERRSSDAARSSARAVAAPALSAAHSGLPGGSAAAGAANGARGVEAGAAAQLGDSSLTVCSRAWDGRHLLTR